MTDRKPRAAAGGPPIRVLTTNLLSPTMPTGRAGGTWASDHFGVVADLALPEHPPGAWIET